MGTCKSSKGSGVEAGRTGQQASFSEKAFSKIASELNSVCCSGMQRAPIGSIFLGIISRRRRRRRREGETGG
jgi:hypothetical protein